MTTYARSLRIPFTRRTFIKAGVFGAGALVAAGMFETWRWRGCTAADAARRTAARALFSAVLPTFLEGVVATDWWTSARMEAALDDVDRTVATLSPAARDELQQLACLLDHAPARLLLAGIWAPWASATPDRARRALERWRFSRTTMLVSAYQALHDITFASWYAQPAHWAAIGYPGPPAIGANAS